LKEKLTTFLLAILVLSSLLLTYQLWYGHHRYDQVDEDIPERVFFEPPRMIASTLTPERILVKSGDGFYLLRHGHSCFAFIWEKLSLALQNLTVYEYRAGESLGEAQPGLKVYFDPLLPVGSGTPWLSEDRYREISKLELWFDGEGEGEGAWAVLQGPVGGDEMALKLPGQLISDIYGEIIQLDSQEMVFYTLLTSDLLSSLPADLLTIKDDLVVPLTPGEMSEFYLKKESLDRDRLVDAFFVDRSLVRKIQEKTGAVIYTDGEKGLRIKEGIEFSDPAQERSFTSLSYLSALSASSKYICSYGGWPEELRLQKLVLNSTGKERRPLYRACWEYYQDGYLLVRPNQAVSTVFTGNGLVEYRRLIYVFQSPAEKRYQVAPFHKAIETSVEVYKEHYEQTKPLTLEAIDLVYAETGPSYQPIAVPAWFIQLNGEQILLQAGDLSLLGGDGQ